MREVVRRDGVRGEVGREDEMGAESEEEDNSIMRWCIAHDAILEPLASPTGASPSGAVDGLTVELPDSAHVLTSSTSLFVGAAERASVESPPKHRLFHFSFIQVLAETTAIIVYTF